MKSYLIEKRDIGWCLVQAWNIIDDVDGEMILKDLGRVPYQETFFDGAWGYLDNDEKFHLLNLEELNLYNELRKASLMAGIAIDKANKEFLHFLKNPSKIENETAYAKQMRGE